MHEGENGGAREMTLSQDDADTYKVIAAGEKAPPGPAIDRLLGLGLITKDTRRPGDALATGSVMPRPLSDAGT